ncbi:MAG: AAA family ATPase [Campylobacteraceae bacterium]|jgi:predicted KAP-like P-loop ATPase|nr:AAA family ATPase [Campylobacteraceae bacterium]
MEDFEKAIDRPISKDEKDILGFKQISNKIAEAIKAFPHAEKTFIISIEGEWGSGKTSLANLVENKIKKDVILVHFNPWMINDFEQLTKYFFSELIKEIIRDDFDAKLKEDILKDIKKLLNILNVRNILEFGFEFFGFSIFSKICKFFKSKNTSEKETLYELKERINSYLQKIPKKIVIVIDDIDRLTDKEIETFFRLIKGVADFDNIIYVLLYNKHVVARSLEKFKSENGEKYLDKIVQYQISVPKPFDGQLINILHNNLEQIIKNLEKAEKTYIFNEYDKDRLNRFYNSKCIGKFVKNLRDLNKIIAIMNFEYPIICENVNFVDYLILSLIRVHNSDLYNSIKNNHKSYIATKEALMEIDNIKREILEDSEKEGKFSEYRELLEIIFPLFLNKNSTHYQANNTHKNRPLANITYFDNYFTFTLSPKIISTKKYNKIKNLMFSNKQNEFRENIIILYNDNKSHIFIEMFYEIDFDNTDISDDEIHNAILNIFYIIYMKNINNYSQNMVNEYFEFGFKLLGKLKGKNRIDDIFNDKRVPLLIKANILYRYKKDKNTLENKFLTNKQFDRLNLKIKSEFEKLTLKDILDNGDLREIKVLDYIEQYGLLENISAEIKEKIFSSKEWFFKILNFFKNDQYLIDKQIMLDTFLPLDEINDYMKNLNIKNLTDYEKELINIWNAKEKDFFDNQINANAP